MCDLIIFIDVSTQLKNVIPLLINDLRYIDKQIESIIISNNSCNSSEQTIINFNGFLRVNSIEIGDNCFGSVSTFRIDRLSQLRSLKIGKNSFTQKKNWYGNVKTKSYYILNCLSLESIEIGQYSFSDYAGDFKLENLPQLQSIQIGKIGIDSCNFYSSSLRLQSMNLILNIFLLLLDLPNLQSITFGNNAFRESLSTIIESTE